MDRPALSLGARARCITRAQQLLIEAAAKLRRAGLKTSADSLIATANNVENGWKEIVRAERAQRGAAEGSFLASVVGLFSLAVAFLSAHAWWTLPLLLAAGVFVAFRFARRRALYRMRSDFNRYLRLVGPDRKVRDLIKKMQLDQAAAARRAKRAQRGDADVGLFGVFVGALLIVFALGAVFADRRDARQMAARCSAVEVTDGGAR